MGEGRGRSGLLDELRSGDGRRESTACDIFCQRSGGGIARLVAALLVYRRGAVL